MPRSFVSTPCYFVSLLFFSSKSLVLIRPTSEVQTRSLRQSDASLSPLDRMRNPKEPSA